MSTGPLVLIPQHFGSLVFDRRSSRYMPFDQESTRLFRECVDEPFVAVVGRAHADERPRLESFFDYFEGAGFFDLSGFFHGTELPATPPADELLGPLAVHLEIIAACNLKCVHCFAGDLPRPDPPLTLDEMESLFYDLASLGSFRLGLTGGEPLLRKDLFEIIDAAAAHGLHPCLTTNGLTLDERVAREFGRRELVWLNVSLDGATAESNDKIRGAGSFDRAVAGIRQLSAHARFTLAFTLMSTNTGEIEACADLARDLGAHTAVFRPLYPVGVAKRNPELMPTYHEYNDALVRLGAHLSPDADLRGIDPFSPQRRARQQGKVFSNKGCGAANLVASVSVRGAVSPCSFLGPHYEGPSIREQSFSDIWRHAKVFRSMRSLSTSGSPDEFAGGCRARSLAFRGDANAPDPWQEEFLANSTVPPSFTLELDP